MPAAKRRCLVLRRLNTHYTSLFKGFPHEGQDEDDVSNAASRNCRSLPPI